MNIDPGPWASWAQIASVSGALLVWAYARNRARIKGAEMVATAKAELEARLTAQDKALTTLTEGFERQFGNNGFVLHEKVKAQAEDLAVVRDGLAAHVAQHVDRSFDK